MIPFDFEYYKPETIDEAVELFKTLDALKKKPIYYGGGTEIISMARVGNRYTEAIIDIKGIPKCNIQEVQNDNLVIGSAVTLTNIAEANHFPLLGSTVKRIADHTIQDKITLGGNICSTIIYRESLLPLLVSDSEIVIAGPDGQRQISINEIFDQRIQLAKDEFIVQVIVKNEFLNKPYLHAKRTKNDKIDYPLITLVALKNNGLINIAFSGLCKFPIRSNLVEELLNDKSMSNDEKIHNIIKDFPYEISNDLSGSSDYKKFMLNKMLLETIEKLEGMVC